MSVVSVGVGITTIFNPHKKVQVFDVVDLIKLHPIVQKQNNILEVLVQVSHKAYH